MTLLAAVLAQPRMYFLSSALAYQATQDPASDLVVHVLSDMAVMAGKILEENLEEQLDQRCVHKSEPELCMHA